MNAPLNNVLVGIPSGSSAEPSRLERGSKFLTFEQIIAFCDEHKIPYELPAEFKARVLPSQVLREVFDRSCGMDPLPPTTLRQSGASTILALETNRIPNPQGDLHGSAISTIANTFGSQQHPDVDVIFIKADPNPAYREAYEQSINEPLAKLLEGVAVTFSSVGWDDSRLTFDQGTHDQFEHFWDVPGFAVDAIGNEGKYGPNGNKTYSVQKHRAFSHAPPLAVSVGAVEHTNNGLAIAGYSSASGPTFLTQLPAGAKIKWDSKLEPADVTGSSAASPIAGKILAMLNKRYGPYLTREQILFAVIATCEPITQVAAFQKHTPNAYTIDYKKNAAGFGYNAGPGGFGLINIHKADHILAHMVAMTQKDADLITFPTEDRREILFRNSAEQHQVNGIYVYDVVMPPGYALKTTLEVEYIDQHGQIIVTSPSGTTFPMVTGMLPIFDIDKIPKGKAYFGISSTQAWAGEELGGKWRITSATPIRRLRFNNHHFLEGDIISKVNIASLLETPVPYDALANAIPLVELKPELVTSNPNMRRLNHVHAEPLLPIPARSFQPQAMAM